jgi:folate-dependent phosphoribosylglycinamide formyltransferase PurN
MKRIYAPKEGEPMKVVFLFSGGASSMKAVLESPGHGELYRVVAAVTNRPEEKAPVGWDIARNYDLGPMFINPFRYKKREDFYKYVTSSLDLIGPHVVGLSGWLKKFSIISDPLLSVPRYKDRIFNVHPARMGIVVPFESKQAWNRGRDEVMRKKRDISHLDIEDALEFIRDGWKRLYIGDDAVSMSALFGEKETCSTIHVIEEEIDGGKIVVQSKRKPIDTEYVEEKLARNALGEVISYAHGLQDEMKEECDGPAFIEFLELAATGRLGIGSKTVFLDWEPLPYGGYQM